MIWGQKVIFEAMPDALTPGDWRVEAIDPLTGECYVAIFSGPVAEDRAKAYAIWMSPDAKEE